MVGASLAIGYVIYIFHDTFTYNSTMMNEKKRKLLASKGRYRQKRDEVTVVAENTKISPLPRSLI
jgi:hypothetical protein